MLLSTYSGMFFKKENKIFLLRHIGGVGWMLKEPVCEGNSRDLWDVLEMLYRKENNGISEWLPVKQT